MAFNAPVKINPNEAAFLDYPYGVGGDGATTGGGAGRGGTVAVGTTPATGTVPGGGTANRNPARG